MKTFDHSKYRPTPAAPMRHRQWPSRTITQAPRWVSVDLRDGNQALLEPMSVGQKRRLWALLVKLGFKEIEVGFPSASKPDYDFVRWLIENDQIPGDVTVQVLVQAREELIVRSFEALRGARRAVMHVYNSTSTVQRERVFGLDRDGITAIARQGAEWVKREAAKHPETAWVFEYTPESFTSTESDYAVTVCEAVLDVWQPTPQHPCIINLPTTVEVASPNFFADQVEYFATHISRRDSIVLSVHTHNDRGCAVAAAELALLAGAERVEGTLLGNGERTGNVDIVTMAMNLYSQGVDPQLDLSNPDEIIQVASECTGISLHPRHPWLGELVYTAFSGSHQDAINKCLHRQQPDEPWQVAYLPIDPKDLGRDYQAVIRINSQSGKGGVAFVLARDYGLNLPRWMQVELAQVVQRVSEARSGEIDSATIHALFMQHFVADQEPVALKGYRLERSSSQDVIAAHIVENGVEHALHGEGEGALSAFVDSWMRHSGQQLTVVDYSEHAIGSGTDAEAIAYVQINIDGLRISGTALDHDTVSASLKALLSALNRAHA
ncbi:2-isopropylmalate synthase [Sulfuricella denitrificans skB26]|uniref:2-isopropylmalate synthase n=1 Tax=Sulfuricella denitrificans (strain DSM 22764 / NBRC 105220 / skB26) TaxID=1163617 RepID=S6AE70_SULDS|nr:2-isopropylmalate synthase [Sulfuricella denitrificans]BAN34031.1 2-isopropylmalate synthase [Sulfuricella denitrificans skB26]